MFRRLVADKVSIYSNLEPEPLTSSAVRRVDHNGKSGEDMLDQFQIANALRETGLLLKAAKDNPYRAQAYLNGARALEKLSKNFDALIRENRLTEIPGIGARLAASITELYNSGETHTLHKLREKIPPGTAELSQLPGLTTKRIAALYKELSITSVDQLAQACEEGKVKNIKGFGEKLEQTIANTIANFRNDKKALVLVRARNFCKDLLEYLKIASPHTQIEPAGAYRRWHEQINEIILVAQTKPKEIKQLIRSFCSYPLVSKVEKESINHCRVRMTNGLFVELHIAKNFAAKLLQTTGPREHFAQLQEIAAKQALILNENGIKRKRRNINVDSEAAIYTLLGLSYIPAELRDYPEELRNASHEDFADLIDQADIQGMTHCHSTYSDGRHSIRTMALAAEGMGMKYITITDHSPTAHYAGGLPIDVLKRQWEEIEQVQETVKIKILKGTECDILSDGALDYPDNILEQFDIIIASIHQRYKLDEEHMTKRVLKAVKNPYFKIWGHPLGRLVLRRDPIPLKMEKVLDAVAESNCAIEINGDPHRLDLEPHWARLARERDIKFVISTDAHSTRDLFNLPYGIHLAQRAGIRRLEVLNTLPFKAFKSAVRPGK